MRRLLLALTLVLVLGVPLPASAASHRQQPTAAQASVVALLPDVTQLPVGFTQQDNQLRSLRQVAAQVGDANAARLLPGWGWQATAYRSFINGGGGTAFLDVSVTLFTSDGNAAAATAYFAAHEHAVNPTWAIATSGPTPLPTASGQLLVSTVWLSGADIDGGIGADLFVQLGPVVIRIGGLAMTASPLPDMNAVAETIVQKIMTRSA